ncbi:MAG: tetratricopeptide repeat protein [bacterium]
MEESWEIESEYYYEQQWDKLIEYYLQRLKNEPEDDYILWRLGDTYLQSGNYQKALEVGKYHYKIHPESPNAVDILLNALEELGKPVEEFPWRGNSKILKIEEALNMAYGYMLGKKRRKRKMHILDLYSEPFHNKGLFLGFSADRFEERIRSDRRFVVNIEGDVSLSSSGEERNEQRK